MNEEYINHTLVKLATKGSGKARCAVGLAIHERLNKIIIFDNKCNLRVAVTLIRRIKGVLNSGKA